MWGALHTNEMFVCHQPNQRSQRFPQTDHSPATPLLTLSCFSETILLIVVIHLFLTPAYFQLMCLCFNLLTTY